jgi:tetratricopeptide (TPR) repeat protein
MGVVYAARDVRLGRRVALKFLTVELDADSTARGRFVQEAQAASALNHPNICTIHEIGESDDGTIFIAMALCEGRTVRERIADGTLTARDALRIGRDLAAGLAAAHRIGIVHRDVKPANIIVSDDGHVRVLDFGLAKVANAGLTRTGATVGTADYMSPEQARGEPVDARSDVWSAGCVLYEMIAGIAPFEAAHDTAVVYRLMNEEPEPLRGHLPPDLLALEAIVLRCLRKDPDARYPSAAELRADLARLADAGAPRPARRAVRYGLAGGGVAVVALAAVLLARGGAPTAGGIAVLPFRATGMDSLECVALSELVSQELGDAVHAASSAFWVIPQSEVRARGIRSGSDAARELAAGIGIEGYCMAVGDNVELDLSVVDAAAMRQVGEARVSMDRIDLRGIQSAAASALTDILPGHPGRREPRIEDLGGTRLPAAFTHFVRGRSNLLRGDSPAAIDAAIDELGRAVMLDPEYARARTALGEALLDRHRFGGDEASLRRAQSELEAAARAAPSLAPAHVALAEAYRRAGDWDSAVRALDRAAAIDSTDWQVQGARGRFHRASGRPEVADRLYRLAVSLSPDYWPLRLEYGTFLFETDRLQEAREQFRHIERLVPESYYAATGMGGVLYAAGRFDEAADRFRRAAEIRRSAGALSNLASMLLLDGRPAEAAETYREAAALPDGERDFRIWGNLALAEKGAGRPDRAASAFGVAIELAEAERPARPDDFSLLIDLASYNAHLGQTGRAVELADRALEQARDGYSWHSAAVVFELAGNREKALYWLGRALQAGYPVQNIAADPDLEDLRRDPRYEAMLLGDVPEPLPEFDP